MSGNFIGYLIGYIVAIIGVGYLLNAAGVGDQWIIAAVLIMIGLGIVYALSQANRDKATTTTHRPAAVRETTVEHVDSAPRPPRADESTRTTTRTYE
jgi:cytoskeletal protein RodZ